MYIQIDKHIAAANKEPFCRHKRNHAKIRCRMPIKCVRVLNFSSNWCHRSHLLLLSLNSKYPNWKIVHIVKCDVLLNIMYFVQCALHINVWMYSEWILCLLHEFPFWLPHSILILDFVHKYSCRNSGNQIDISIRPNNEINGGECCSKWIAMRVNAS